MAPRKKSTPDTAPTEAPAPATVTCPVDGNPATPGAPCPVCGNTPAT